MTTAAVTNTFTASTSAKSAEVNANFTDLVTYINSNAIVKDGSLAFTAVPTGPATDPSSANHLSRKAYVDSVVGRASGYSTGSHTLTANDSYQQIMSATFTNPAKAVVVEVWGSVLQGAGTGATVAYKSRIGISIDGGGSYTYSTQVSQDIAPGRTGSFTPFFRKAGTATGNIIITLDHYQTAGALSFGTANEAAIMYDIFKTVTL